MEDRLKTEDQKQHHWYRLAQWTWGFPQSLSGAVVYLRYRNYPHFSYHGASVTVWPHKSSLSLGMFLFLTNEPFYHYKNERKRKSQETFARGLLVHEYGHTIQSLIFGPLYLVAVGLPSVLWANLPQMQRWREKHHRSYFSVYPENHANQLGEWVLGEKSIGTPIS